MNERAPCSGNHRQLDGQMLQNPNQSIADSGALKMKYKLFGKTGLRVSEVAFGTGTFGTAWGWGSTPEQSAEIFKAYVEAGGNFFDCADGYQNGEAETILGNLIHHDRDDFIISTKYTTAVGARSISKTGNSRKGMISSIEGSLRRLKTDYVDIFWVHMPDLVTPTDEIVRGLEDIVRDGKARYIGMSCFPAWRISRAITIAELRGWAPVNAVQIEYSLAERSAERELIPMADAYGLAVTVWAALGGGILTGKYRNKNAEGRLTKGGGAVRAMSPDREEKILSAIDAAAKDLGATPAQIALAWVRARETVGSSFIPILGARTMDQLTDNLAAISVTLDDSHLTALNEASAIEPGFPHELASRPEMRDLHTGGYWDAIIKPTAKLP